MRLTDIFSPCTGANTNSYHVDMIVAFLNTSIWLVQNIQYVIALIFGFTTILSSIIAWYIFKWLIPSPLSYIPFLRTNPSKPIRKPRNVKSKGDIKPTTADKRATRSTTTRIRKTPVNEISVFRGLATFISSTIGSAFVLCSIASSLICAYSLTEKGCYTLRHIGILEWLPWKAGLKCYKTRWDWFADLLGEFMLTVLQGHEFGQSSMKSM